MKKLLQTFLLSILTICQNINAQSKEYTPAVNMVSYEQSWLDDKGTIALKNNTSEDIHNVSFVLEYLDMQGIPIDYETFSYNINIAPGMTKKLDIPAYEHSRMYHYYKTKDEFGNPAFKLAYKLKDYNFTPTNTTVDSPDSDNNDSLSSNVEEYLIYLFLGSILLLGICVAMYVLVAIMAQRRNRNPGIWLLLSFIATPLLICIILLIIGKEHKNQDSQSTL